ncbi:MAG: hypothetical protein IJA65_01405, partial [Acholeplasmatales bacterium]|nr:hypothetical protein [Acholeplasmatales bacterium]
IYKNLDNIDKIKKVLKYLNYDIDYINNVINNLKIKNDKELALSKEEITKNFIGNEKSKIINKVLINILEGKIKNTEEDIKNLINRS